jgi:hypothetical protein
MRRYAESHADAWCILSAKHGLVEPAQVLAPYEVTLNRLGKAVTTHAVRYVARRIPGPHPAH